MAQRIDGFKQIEGFYSWVFNNPDKIRPTHISLYLFLWNQNNRSHWVEWFKCPYDLAMQGACIGNNGTYYKCLDELKEWGLIDYQKGINGYKAPIVRLFQLYDNGGSTEQATVPLSEQLTAQQYAQQPVHIYKLITDNIKPITEKYDEFEKFVLSLSSIKPKKFDFKKSLLSLGISEQTASDWMKVRKDKGASNTGTAFNKIKTQIEISPLSPEESIKYAVERSWRGFEAEWIKNSGGNKQTPTQNPECYFKSNYSGEGMEIRGTYARYLKEVEDFGEDNVKFIRYAD